LYSPKGTSSQPSDSLIKDLLIRGKKTIDEKEITYPLAYNIVEYMKHNKANMSLFQATPLPG